MGAPEGRLSASSLVMEILMACGRRFVLLAFKSKNPVRFGSRTGRGAPPRGCVRTFEGHSDWVIHHLDPAGQGTSQRMSETGAMTVRHCCSVVAQQLLIYKGIVT